MPRAAPRPCTYPGCTALTDAGRCERHRAQIARETDERRGSARERGYTSRWDKARGTYLRANPLCRYCLELGRVEPATVVDHVKPHRGDQTLFWNTSNWQPLCKRCHDIKTATEDGGFGRG
ncbi:MAG TPA: HNH endonuclease signature motif containing protein [Burkholderiaceae bacterium]|nr:HNH endonuclease signature motif containing protein [Burkholderiaceae bacterium]